MQSTPQIFVLPWKQELTNQISPAVFSAVNDWNFVKLYGIMPCAPQIKMMERKVEELSTVSMETGTDQSCFRSMFFCSFCTKTVETLYDLVILLICMSRCTINTQNFCVTMETGIDQSDFTSSFLCSE